LHKLNHRKNGATTAGNDTKMKEIITPTSILKPTGKIHFAPDGYSIEYLETSHDGTPSKNIWGRKIYTETEMAIIAKTAIEYLINQGNIALKIELEQWENQF
jgi:hypothetical protein